MFFVATVIFFLFFVHFLFFRIFIGFVDTDIWWKKTLVGSVFFLLSISPLLSAVLSYRFGGWWPKMIYNFSITWLGFAINLLVAIILSWITIFLLEFFNVNFRAVYVFVFFMVFCLTYSVYGLWQAKNFTITRVDVSSLSFPDKWKSKKVVQISDVHLGNMNGTSFSEKVFGRVAEMKPDIVFITGDLFDGVGSRDLDSLMNPIKKIKAKDGIFFIFGNHEDYFIKGNGALDKNALTVELQKYGVKVLDNSYALVDDVQIIGVSYPGLKDTKEFLDANKDFSSKKPSILLFHTPSNLINNFDGDLTKSRSNAYFSPQLDFSAAKELGVGLQLSGHTHQGQFFPFNLVAKWVYGKYYYGANKKDNLIVYTSSGVGTWGPPFRTMTKSEIVDIKF